MHLVVNKCVTALILYNFSRLHSAAIVFFRIIQKFNLTLEGPMPTLCTVFFKI
jgi:hypothetical protein